MTSLQKALLLFFPLGIFSFIFGEDLLSNASTIGGVCNGGAVVLIYGFGLLICIFFAGAAAVFPLLHINPLAKSIPGIVLSIISIVAWSWLVRKVNDNASMYSVRGILFLSSLVIILIMNLAELIPLFIRRRK
jgi:hypothetical protein